MHPRSQANAGINRPGVVGDNTEEEYDIVLDTNLKDSYAHSARHSARPLAAPTCVCHAYAYAECRVACAGAY